MAPKCSIYLAPPLGYLGDTVKSMIQVKPLLKRGSLSYDDTGHSMNGKPIYNLSYHGSQFAIEGPRKTAKLVCGELISLTNHHGWSVLIPDASKVVLAWIVPHGDKSILNYVTKDFVSQRGTVISPLSPLYQSAISVKAVDILCGSANMFRTGPIKNELLPPKVTLRQLSTLAYPYLSIALFLVISCTYA